MDHSERETSLSRKRSKMRKKKKILRKNQKCRVLAKLTFLLHYSLRWDFFGEKKKVSRHYAAYFSWLHKANNNTKVNKIWVMESTYLLVLWLEMKTLNNCVCLIRNTQMGPLRNCKWRSYIKPVIRYPNRHVIYKYCCNLGMENIKYIVNESFKIM